MERFTIETKYTYENRYVKSIIRGKINYKESLLKSYNPHSIYNNIKACSCSGKPTGGKYFYRPPDVKYAVLNHYVTKSVREFFYKKYKTPVDVDTIPKETKDYLFNYFFRVNKKTKEKVDIFNQIYHSNYS